MFATSTIAGNLTADPELKTVGANNTSLATFTIAVNDRTGAEEKVYFFSMQAWGNRAEAIAKYFSKGDRIAVCCDVRQEAWTDAETHKKRRKDVHVVRNIMFTSKGGGKEERPRKKERQMTTRDLAKQVPMATGGDFDDDDDIPF